MTFHRVVGGSTAAAVLALLEEVQADIRTMEADGWTQVLDSAVVYRRPESREVVARFEMLPPAGGSLPGDSHPLLHRI